MSSRAYRRYLRQYEAEEAEEAEAVSVPFERPSRKMANQFESLSIEQSEEPAFDDSEIVIPEQQQKRPATGPLLPVDLPEPLLLAGGPCRTKHSKPAVLVNAKLLNYKDELQKIFGSSLVKRTCGQGLVFVDARPGWQRSPLRPALEMQQIEGGSKDCSGEKCCFRFVHDPNYQSLQKRFFGATDSHDPEALVNLISYEPFHVDSLLALSDYYRDARNAVAAGDLVEKAIYALERSFHHRFLKSVIEGNCYVSYKVYENRVLFLSLYRLLQMQFRKGCWRTCLESARFLYEMNSNDDPIAALLVMDFCFLAAESHSQLVDFYQKNRLEKSLDSLPNWAYSVALGYFLLGRQEEAASRLREAVSLFPATLALLVQKCSFSIQLEKCSCSEDFDLSQAATETWNQSQRLLHNIERLYVERSHLCWKRAEVCAWIVKTLPQVPSSPEALSFRKTQFLAPPLAYFRHLLAADLPDFRLHLPASISGQQIQMFDLLPDPDSHPSYSDSYFKRPLSNAVASATGSIRGFFRSLISPGSMLDRLRGRQSDGLVQSSDSE